MIAAEIPCPLWETKKEIPSFSEEKEAKRLLFLASSRIDPGHGLELGSSGDIKVFCFFSSEKKNFFHFGAGST
jgi:hypothetical protein